MDNETLGKNVGYCELRVSSRSGVPFGFMNGSYIFPYVPPMPINDRYAEARRIVDFYYKIERVTKDLIESRRNMPED